MIFICFAIYIDIFVDVGLCMLCVIVYCQEHHHTEYKHVPQIPGETHNS